jgi:DNA-binding transcriptional regulator YiaG
MNRHADERLPLSIDAARALEKRQHKGQYKSTNILTLLGVAERQEVERELSERNAAPTTQEVMLAVFDASIFTGLQTIVYDAAIERIDDAGERSIELPKLPELLASVAVARCLMQERLRGREIRAIRRIMKLSLGEFAKRLDDKTAVETVSRWESESQPMGVYAEKVLRLLVCEELRKEALGIEYSASNIVDLKVRDPWKIDPSHAYPAVELGLISIKQSPGLIIEAWSKKKIA